MKLLFVKIAKKKFLYFGYSSRNHCPFCLFSKHLDNNPGDRQNMCHGLLEPIGIEINSKKGYVIVYRCQKCGEIKRNISARDDNTNLIIKLSAKPLNL